MSKIAEIPVTIKFDPKRLIGKLIIDMDQLPKHEDYMFGIAGQLTPNGFVLNEIAVVPDLDK